MVWLLFLVLSLRKKRPGSAAVLVLIGLIGLFFWTYTRPFTHTLVIYEPRSLDYPHPQSNPTEPELAKDTFSDPRLWDAICKGWEGKPPLEHQDFLAAIPCRSISLRCTLAIRATKLR